MLGVFGGSVSRFVGVVGVGFYILSYGLLQMGILRSSGYAYSVLNLVGAFLVLVSLQEAFNLASAIIQTAWIAISLFGIGRIFWLNRRIRFSKEESELLKDAFPEMPSPLARRLLDRGVWADWTPGQELTREGEMVTHLHYILSGRARVISGGRAIAAVRRGLIGEMNVMRPGPASATVVIAEPARVFSIPGDVLRARARTDGDLKLLLEQFLAKATQKKLMEANARLVSTEEETGEGSPKSAQGL